VTVPTSLERNYGVLAMVDGTLALAHFYPMVAVYDAAGWHVTPPAPHSDVTFSDMAFYLLQVTAPAQVVIAGGGTLVEAVSGPDGTQTLTFASGPARDIYLAASAGYTRTTLTTPAGITLTAYAPASESASAERVTQVAAAALHDYAARYGPYPYRELDLAAIPTLALGIEYPGLIALNRDLFDPQADFGGTPVSVLLEATTAHEVAHQWFYNLVGDDQLNEPWLDEALAQYATWRYYLDEQGPDGANGFAQSLAARWARVDQAEIPIGLPAADYTAAEYSAIVYGRGPLFVDALGDTIGQDALTDFLRDYAATYRWGIATTADFQALAEADCGCDLSRLFAQWVYAAP
jgi:aminopeptidase N